MAREDEELLDIVDAQDRLIGTGKRGDIHARGLMHRSVHVFLVDTQGRIYLQKRARTKQEYPGTWDSSAAGHLAAGEGYDSAAARELAEELGVEAPLQAIVKLPASQQTGFEHTVLYVADYRAARSAPTPNPEEIEEGRFFSEREIETLLADRPEEATPSLRLLLGEYRRHASPDREKR